MGEQVGSYAQVIMHWDSCGKRNSEVEAFIKNKNKCEFRILNFYKRLI